MPRSRAADYDDKREAILHRAAVAFARDGYDRVSMAGLAAECGVSKALLYHYYASKEAAATDYRSVKDLKPGDNVYWNRGYGGRVPGTVKHNDGKRVRIARRSGAEVD